MVSSLQPTATASYLLAQQGALCACQFAHYLAAIAEQHSGK